MKKCPQCNGLKPMVDFYIRKSGFKSGMPISCCKSCKSKNAKDLIRRKRTGDLKERYIAMVGIDHRRCCKCLEVKPLREFYICKTGEAKGKPQAKCKVCNVQDSAEYAKTDEAKKRYNATRRIKRIESYGITLEQFEEMVRRQHGLCAICNKKPAHVLRIDHDHKTGNLRGLLCLSCNAALGWAERNYKQIEDYLSHHDSHPLYSKEDLLSDPREMEND